MRLRWLDARLDLELRCNYRCVYCYNRPDTWKPGETEFAIDTLEPVLANLGKHCWSVYLSCGGEPLIHRRFADALLLAKKHLSACDVSLVTNGLLLDDLRRRAIVESNLSRISVSIDSVDPAVYESLCGSQSGSLVRVTNNVASLVSQRVGRWPRVTVTAIVMKRTLGGLEDLARWAASCGIDGLKLQWLRTDYCPGMSDQAVGPTPEVLDVLRRVRAICARNRVSYDHPLHTHVAKVMSIAQAVREVKHPVGYLGWAVRKLRSAMRRGCRVADMTLWVARDGSVSVCQRDQTPIANLAKTPEIDTVQLIRHHARALRAQATTTCAGCSYLTGGMS